MKNNRKKRKILTFFCSITNLFFIGSITSCSLKILPNHPTPVDSCEITFKTNGGTIEGSSDDKKEIVQTGTKWKDVVKPNIIWADGKILDFWSLYSSPDTPVDPEYTIEANTTFFPVNKIAYCLVTFNYDPDLGESLKSGSAEVSVDKGTKFGLVNTPLLEKDGFVLDGWSTEREGEPIGFDEEINEPLDVYPLWSESTEDNTIIAHDDSSGDIQYICDLASMCDPDSDIKLTPKLGGEQITQSRDEFNWRITIGQSVVYIPDCFLCECSNFNMPIEFTNPTSSRLTFIGSDFLSGCSSFNQKLTFPDQVRCISEDFLGDCSSFVGQIDEDHNGKPEWEFELPGNVEIIGKDFLSGCTQFNSDIEFIDTLAYLGCNTMLNCDNFTSILKISTPLNNVEYGNGAAWSTYNPESPMYTTGFKVDGTYADDFIGQYPPGFDVETHSYRNVEKYVPPGP